MDRLWGNDIGVGERSVEITPQAWRANDGTALCPELFTLYTQTNAWCDVSSMGALNTPSLMYSSTFINVPIYTLYIKSEIGSSYQSRVNYSGHDKLNAR